MKYSKMLIGIVLTVVSLAAAAPLSAVCATACAHYGSNTEICVTCCSVCINSLGETTYEYCDTICSPFNF